jgi:hypothetical protein
MLGTLLVKNSLKQDVLSSLLFIFALERTVSTVQANQERLKVNWVHQFLICAYYVNLLGEIIRTFEKNTDI